MGKKAIVLIRTSTVKQEIESQRTETVAFARSDNFDDKDIIVIGGEGASAIKLDEQYRFNMKCVYDTIETCDIKCVYAWSVDRIGRDEEELMKFKKYLIVHHVNLKIKNPSLTLLDENGKVNDGMEIAFSLYATMAKQEMEQKKARFSRAKKRNKKDGKWNGGRIMFGYKVDENGFFDRHPENAKVVNDIFNEYALTPVSTRALAKKYPDIGFKKTKNLRNQECYIQRILKNKAYVGEGDIPYPPIVDKDVFYMVQQKLKDFRTLPKVKYKETPYYCQGLVYERNIHPLDGKFDIHRMRVKKSECSYVSYTEHFSLNINLFDSAILYVVNRVLNEFDSSTIEKQIKQSREEYNVRIESLKEQIKEKQSRLDELTDRYFGSGTISTAAFERNEAKIKNDIIGLQKEITTVMESANKIKDFEFDYVDMYGLSDEERRNIIVKYVLAIYAYKIDRYRSEIDVWFQKPMSMGYNFVYDRFKKTMERYYYHENGEPDVEEVEIPVVRDIKGRKRIYKGKKYRKSGKQLDVQG